MGAVDVSALLLAIVISATITVALAFFARSGGKRDWMVAGIVAVVLFVIGLADLVTETPRETHVATVIVGALLPTAGAMGFIHASRNLKPRFRWPLVFLTAFVLLLGGLLIGASIVPRFIAR